MLVSLLTFPGIVVHELAHLLFCKLFGVAVFKVRLFRFGNPAGYVVHEKPDKVYQSLLIAVGPFAVNSLVGALAAAPAVLRVLRGTGCDHADCIRIWLGFSIAMHAFPSTGDAKAMWRAVWSRGTSLPAKLLGTPLVALVYAGAMGSALWLDAVYGAAVVVLAAKALARFI